MTPEKLRSATALLTREQQRQHLNDDRFSVHEHICHLRDIEDLAYSQRIRLMLSSEMAFMTNVDGWEIARRSRYKSRVLRIQLRQFADMRAKNLSRIGNLSNEELGRQGHLEQVGVITLADLLEMIVDHDGEHVRGVNDLVQTVLSLR